MKSITNILISHAIFLGIFAVAAVALAQEETGTSTPEERREALQEQAAERRAEIASSTEARRAEFASTSEARKEAAQEVREERRIQLQAQAQTRITNLAANMSNRMDAAIERLTNIADRLDSRIAKIQAEGVDTSAAEASLASARMSIDAAAAEIATIDTEVAAVVGSENVRTAWEGLKAKYQEIKNYIKTAHTELRNTVEALKTAVAAGPRGAASTTEPVLEESN
tara:strand:+ start:2307 stop:2984 length:678 start_codon:yes stop_codon:yes gene_type:complete